MRLRSPQGQGGFGDWESGASRFYKVKKETDA